MKERNFFTRNPDFLLIWAGQIFSQSGGRMYQIAMVWWILSIGLEGSGKLVGLFMVMAALPPILFVKKIGRTIDTKAGRAILITCDLMAFVVIAAVAGFLGAGGLTLACAYVAGFVSALLQAFIDPTLNKSVAEVVPAEDVEKAVSCLASTQSMANFAGAVMGAMLIGKLGVAGTAALAALGYLISSTATMLAKFRYVKAAAAAGEPTEATLSGWAVLDTYPLLKKILIGFGFINFFSTPMLVVLPIYVKKTLLAGADTLGYLEASLWLGLIAGTFLSPVFSFVKSRIRFSGLILSIMGVCLMVPGLARGTAIYAAALFIAGAAVGLNNVKFIALFQEIVAPELKGRFFALMSAVIGFSFPIAYFLFGLLTDLLSPPEVCLIQGAGVVATALFFLTLEEPSAKAAAEATA
jgi:MFS family permease